MNFKRKLLIFLISFYLILPNVVFAYPKYLIPGGENVGIRIQSDGVFVVGFYEVNGKPYFGEMTFTPAVGFGKWTSEKNNNIVGEWINLDWWHCFVG